MNDVDLQQSRSLEPARRPTRARLQSFFLRQLTRTGSQVEAAARTGITSRTVRRWRAGNLVFALRYDEALTARQELLEDVAMRRALRAGQRPAFHRGKPVATDDRHNDAMLMRVLAHFDRVSEREAVRPGREFPRDLERMSDIETLRSAGWIIQPPPDANPRGRIQAPSPPGSREMGGENVLIERTGDRPERRAMRAASQEVSPQASGAIRGRGESSICPLARTTCDGPGFHLPERDIESACLRRTDDRTALLIDVSSASTRHRSPQPGGNNGERTHD